MRVYYPILLAFALLTSQTASATCATRLLDCGKHLYISSKYNWKKAKCDLCTKKRDARTFLKQPYKPAVI